MRDWIIGVSLSFVILFVVLALRPVSADGTNSEILSGKITQVYEDGTRDAVFRVAGQSHGFYINRGLNNFSLQYLKSKALGKNVVIAYSTQWTPLDPFGKASKHLFELKVGNEIIYSEIRKVAYSNSKKF